MTENCTAEKLELVIKMLNAIYWLLAFAIWTLLMLLIRALKK